MPSQDIIEARKLIVDESNSQNTVEGMIPYFSFDTLQTKYLSYRACGFTIRESRKLCGLKWDKTIRDWRKKDSLFAYWDGEGLMRLQEMAGSTFLMAEFSRNFRLLMEKDARVIAKSMDAEDQGHHLSDEDQAYLLKIRGFYTPQQLESIKKVLNNKEDGGDNFNFTQFVVNLQKDNGTQNHNQATNYLTT